MPYPYAYYKEEYNGPLHGTELTSPVLYLTTSLVVTPASIVGGQLDVSGKSHIFLNSSSGAIVIDSIVGGKDGQALFFHKNTSANSVTIKHIAGTNGRVFTSSDSDIVMPNGRYGGTILVCRDAGPTQDWFEIVNGGFFGDGSPSAPSIAFASEPMMGIFKQAAGTLGFATSGIGRFLINNNYIRSLLAHRFSDGSVTLPSITFESDPDTGFYKTANSLVFSGDGIQKLELFKTGAIGLASPNFRSDFPFEFTTSTATTPQQVRAGSLLSSDVLADSSLVPTNGIYSKGNVRTAGQFQGTATSALYADLAENYEADAYYAPGTIVKIGGSKEITLADQNQAFGVISTNPGFLLNAVQKKDAEALMLPVALAGKVPCRVIGPCRKGQPLGLNPNHPGCASVGFEPRIGRALEDKDYEQEGLVMIVTRAVI